MRRTPWPMSWPRWRVRAATHILSLSTHTHSLSLSISRSISHSISCAEADAAAQAEEAAAPWWASLLADDGAAPLAPAPAQEEQAWADSKPPRGSLSRSNAVSRRSSSALLATPSPQAEAPTAEANTAPPTSSDTASLASRFQASIRRSLRRRGRIGSLEGAFASRESIVFYSPVRPLADAPSPAPSIFPPRRQPANCRAKPTAPIRPHR
jgi:hypothetical protein